MIAAEFQLRTERLLLRPWRDADIEPFAAMCADPLVMRFFESTRTRPEVEEMVARLQADLIKDGFGFLAAELPGEVPFVGIIGIRGIRYEAHFTPAVEVGWRLAPAFWHRGLATEGARAALADGFGRCGLREIVAVAVPANLASLAVMARLGMTRDLDGDFDHPGVTEGHALRCHALYRMTAPQFTG